MKKLIIIANLLVIVTASFAQPAMHLYHMKNRTVFGQELNPTFFPKAKAYVSLPGISNINFAFSSPLSASDVFTKTGDSTRVNVDLVLENSRENHFIEFSNAVPVLGFGFRLNKVSTFSFFTNVKTAFSIGVPYDAARLAWQGNGGFVGQKYEIDDLRLNTLSYGEVGFGYSRELKVVGRPAIIGVRVKYLVGIGSANIDNESTVGLTVEEQTYKNTLTFEDAAFRIAGTDITNDDAGGEFVSGNSGFGLDLGAEYTFNDDWKFNFSLIDIGGISWKNEAYEVRLKNASIELEGVDLANIDDFGDAFGDNLDSLFKADTTATQFSTPLKTTMFLGAEYKVGKHGTAFATYANYFAVGKLRTALGVGYMQEVGRILAVSGSVMKIPLQGINLGAGMTVRTGFFQLHMSANGLEGLANVNKAKGFSFNFGINFLFGKVY